MSSSLSVDEFLDYLKKSELVAPEELDAALATIKSDAPETFVDSGLLAGVLIKREIITGWHARQLMKRKYKGFYLRQYRILKHLGSGGMSAVYLAEHLVMKRRVAVKVLPKRKLNAVYLERFMREAQAIASLDHPHIVRAYDVDRFEDVHYIVMEYFEGQNLRQRVQADGPLAYEEAASFIRQAALGLGHAHQIGIVHRDVKPDNILVNKQNLVKILDLGLALLDEANFSGQTSSFDQDKILGTADYLAPEQALDSHNVDARADVYGLGATLYFCLTGSPPFPEGSITERLLAHQRKEPPSIFNVRPDAPIDLVEICSIMMQKKPENRFQTALQVVDAMERWLIKHGFATAADFSRADDAANDANSEDDDFSQFNNKIFVDLDVDAERRFLQNADFATEIGFGRGGFGFLSEDSTKIPRQNADVVDLFGADGQSAARRRDPGTSSRPTPNVSNGAPDNGDFLLSKRADAAALDPLELALSEIADTTKSKLNAVPPDATTPQTPILPSVANAATTFQIVPAPTEPEPEPPLERLFGDWAADVPVWFWTFAVGGYGLALFLAGILFTLLTNIN